MKTPALVRHLSVIAASLLVGTAVTEAQYSETTVTTTTTTVGDPPVIVIIADTPASAIVPTRAASTTDYGTLGLSQVISAQSLGTGRLNLAFRANFYQQDPALTPRNGRPGLAAGSQVTTASGAIAYGMTEIFDVFGALNIYNIREAGAGDGSGFGTSVLGAQIGIPFSKDQPIRVGAQLAALFGTADNQINWNHLDGYNYLETRTRPDVMVRVTESWLGVNEKEVGFKLHLNQGVISSFERGKDIGLVLGAGVEVIPLISVLLGLEANWRTYLMDLSMTDPFWVTGSLTWRTPAFVNITLGGDYSLSQDRDGTTDRGPDPALAPWRIFGGLDFSFDTQSARRRAEQARLDSLRRLASMSGRDFAREDSLARAARDAAERARRDSIALADARRRIAELSAEERVLLTTGLLLLDNVYFQTDKWDISINSEPYLTLIARMLTKYPALQIEVGGHTDSRGSDAYNMQLSQRRAEAVRNYMIQVAPELASRLVARGYGERQPKATNSTAEGMQLNRRTELRVLNREALQQYQP